MKNGRLDSGEVIISLNNEEIVLHPTMRAAMMISRQYSGFAKARQLIVDENFDAVVFVIRIGSNMNDKMARKLDERVWENGLDVELLVPLIKYIAILNNGGRPLPMDIEGVFEVMGDSSDSNQTQIEDQSSGNG